jgi:hypothetical protein
MYPGVALGRQSFVFRDFGLFSYPVAFFQRECFWRGDWPLWNPLNNCGIPFLAQWNTMSLYPPSLIYLVLPLQWSLSFFCLLHLVWGGLGMYLLARRWTNHSLAGAVAGIVFSFNGLTLNFLMWPSHVATLSWLPWVLWLVPHALQTGGKAIAWAVLAGAMQFLAGGPETIFFTWLLLVLLTAGEWFSAHQQPLNKADHTVWRYLVWSRTDTRLVMRFLAIAGLVLALCAAQLLPFLALLSHSQRDAAYSSSSHNWAMPFWGWANFLVPLFRTSPTSQGVYFQNGQYWTSSYYAGIGTVFLCLVAVRQVRQWRVRLLALTSFLALVLAWGDTSALFSLLRACLPGLGFVRYPVKFVILVLAVAPLLTAFGVKALAEKAPGRFEWACATALLLMIGGIIAAETRTPESVWTTTFHNGLARCVFLLLTLGLLPLALSQSSRRQYLFGWLLLGVFWVDLITHVPNQNPTINPALYSSTCADPGENEKAKPSLGSRVFISPGTREFLTYNSLPNTAENFRRNRSVARANANLLDAIPQVDGFFSLVPRESFELNKALYSHPGAESTGLLDFMGVSRITGPGSGCGWIPRRGAFPLITAGQAPAFIEAQTAAQVCSSPDIDFGSTVYLPSEARGKVSATPQPEARVLNPKFENHKITLQTEAPGPCMVVLSQTYYPAWKAYVDGKATKLWRANNAFQSVEVPSGKHRLEFVYEDGAFHFGLLLSASGLLLVSYLACQTPRPNAASTAPSHGQFA